ncbi:MarR family transcriptional regulator [Permianibacter sp. IMCC34836]|uniref:MarR family winged helix-turn-helix transcriptional regulator n=1 Tax=Permianibacter fluminis TaxID=2738515 RepID=UPI001555B283|nr:MarR family transcriptional regulator [Permianibacter fluminis]NQD38752.1 MarR family transcriptional regulator [Permianibacter fluminis]
MTASSPSEAATLTAVDRSGSAATASDATEVLRCFRLIFGNARQHFRYIEDSCGLGGAQIWALGLVRARPGIRVSELADAMSVHQTTTSNLVAGLSRKGLLRRERAERDQRVVRLYITDAAAALLLRSPGPVEGILLQALRHMDESNLQQLNAVLQQVLAHMQTINPALADIPLTEL